MSSSTGNEHSSAATDEGKLCCVDLDMSQSNIDVTNLYEEQKKSSEADEFEALVSKSLQKTGKVGKRDFTMITVIGTGSYGKVLLVKKKDTLQHFAMKVLKKKHLSKTN